MNETEQILEILEEKYCQPLPEEIIEIIEENFWEML